MTGGGGIRINHLLLSINPNTTSNNNTSGFRADAQESKKDDWMGYKTNLTGGWGNGQKPSPGGERPSFK